MQVRDTVQEDFDMPDERPRDLGSHPSRYIQGKNDGKLAHAELDDMVALPKLVLRLIALPVWLPYKGWKIVKRRREMAEFARMQGRYAISGDRTAREITLAWVKEHPDDYILGEYDPGVPKLQRKFKKLLERRR
jgi:hypothetical protein